jgi:hypothetical protein
MKKEKNESRAESSGGLVFVGSIILGVGVGLLDGNLAWGILFGFGMGFVLFGIIKAFVKN